MRLPGGSLLESGRGGARRPKIVFVNRYFSPDESATSRILSDLAFRLAEHGLSVAVVTSRQLYDNPAAELAPREVIRGVTVHRVGTSTHGRARLAGRALDYLNFHVAASFELTRALSRGDVVVAKTDPPLISIAVARAARGRGALLINWLQDLFPEVLLALAPQVMPGWLQRRLLSARDRSLLGAAMNVVLSEGMRTRLISRGIDSERIRIIPNWADTTNITPRSAGHSQTRRRLGLQGQFVVGYSGNLGRAHEFDTLLAAARLLRSDPDISFLITGGGAKAKAVCQSVESEGLVNFQFLEYQPPELLADSLAASDVHFVSLLPALEGLIVPSKIYGILAAGRPSVFVGDGEGDLASLIRRHDCGIAVGVGDSERLAAQLRALRSDSERLASMGARARDLALTGFTSQHALANWLAMLDRIAPQVGRPNARSEGPPCAEHRNVTVG